MASLVKKVLEKSKDCLLEDSEGNRFVYSKNRIYFWLFFGIMGESILLKSI